MRKSFLFFLWVLIIVTEGLAQTKQGTWRSHLPYSHASRLMPAGDNIFCITIGGLFAFNKSDKSIDKISKESGLSDTEISALGYDPESGITVIAYSNANVDLIVKGKITNIPDIMRKQIMGDKKIYNILINNGFAYLSTGFGVVVLDLVAGNIPATYYIGDEATPVKVNDLAFRDPYFFAATDEGVYSANKNNNLLDYRFWQKIAELPGLSQTFSAIETVGNRVYVAQETGILDGDIIYYNDGSDWLQFDSFGKYECNYLSSRDDKLIVSSRYHAHIFPTNGKAQLYLIRAPKCAYLDENSVLWIADSELGLVRKELPAGELEVINPNGPKGNSSSHIASSGNIVYSVAGGLKSDYNNQYLNAEVNIFRDGLWKSYFNTAYKDFHRIVIDPADPEHFFIASWGYGLFEFQGDSLIEIFRDNNSTLQTVIPGFYFRLGGLAFDNSGNLWVSNASVAQPLSVLKKDGKWISFDLDDKVNSPFTGDILVSQTGYKFMLLTPGRGLLAIDDNNTIDNPDDDRYQKLDVRDINNSLITNDIFAFAEDKDGNIWLGTNKGILVYYNPAGAFDPDNFYAQEIIIPRNDGTPYGDPLLGTETVTAIAIDGANRKWLGTRNAGVSLVSADGLKQVHNFTAENSPLLSNSITSIAINNTTGEVFFSTDKGIISFQSDATGATDNFNSVYVFPNPVREDFSGDITITGLPANSTVKITDLNGNLVYETLSLGGQALWNGENYLGEKVRTGVYLVFCSNEDGSLSHVTKLLFIH